MVGRCGEGSDELSETWVRMRLSNGLSWTFGMEGRRLSCFLRRCVRNSKKVGESARLRLRLGARLFVKRHKHAQNLCQRTRF
jgi:hypothetical protein